MNNVDLENYKKKMIKMFKTDVITLNHTEEMVIFQSLLYDNSSITIVIVIIILEYLFLIFIHISGNIAIIIV